MPVDPIRLKKPLRADDCLDDESPQSSDDGWPGGPHAARWVLPSSSPSPPQPPPPSQPVVCTLSLDDTLSRLSRDSLLRNVSSRRPIFRPQVISSGKHDATTLATSRNGTGKNRRASLTAPIVFGRGFRFVSGFSCCGPCGREFNVWDRKLPVWVLYDRLVSEPRPMDTGNSLRTGLESSWETYDRNGKFR